MGQGAEDMDMEWARAADPRPAKSEAMSAPDRIWATGIGQDPLAHWWRDRPLMTGTTFLNERGPTITAWKAALRTLGADPDIIARKAQKEASNG